MAKPVFLQASRLADLKETGATIQLGDSPDEGYAEIQCELEAFCFVLLLPWRAAENGEVAGYSWRPERMPLLYPRVDRTKMGYESAMKEPVILTDTKGNPLSDEQSDQSLIIWADFYDLWKKPVVGQICNESDRLTRE